MQWTDVVAGMSVLEVAGARDATVGGVQYDSRRVGPGDVFVAMRGGTTDGNRYVAQALERGASALVTDSQEVFEATRSGDVPVALVEHGRRALAEVSSAVFGRPQDKMKVSAVTGTNGKTTTAWLLAQMLESVGRKCLLIGTIETRIAGVVRKSEHTTPEARDLFALFAEAVVAGCTEVVMEMSSHALEQERVWGIPVDVAIFTNLTQDHLDFHGTMAAYARAKMKLFNGAGTGVAPRVAVINNDAEYAGAMIDAYKGDEFVVRYGVEDSYGANHFAKNVEMKQGSIQFDFVTPEETARIYAPISGRVNVENLLAAMCAGLARGLTMEEVAAAAATLKPASGRFEIVAGSDRTGFTVVVDYAHTDDALKNLLVLGRELVCENAGRVVTMFGCGGDRDKTKRPKMGRVAGEQSDMVVVTSDNPRSEEPMAIINDVLSGIRETRVECVVEPDRRVAIEVAIRAARPGDIVLLAGKGHEKVQIFADGPVPFDDVAVASEVLHRLQIEGAE